MNMRINDIEFRMLDNRNPEIVRWAESNTKPFCYTLLSYGKDKEGYFVEFVGDRPFQYEDTECLWKLMEYGQSVLNARFKLED